MASCLAWVAFGMVLGITTDLGLGDWQWWAIVFSASIVSAVPSEPFIRIRVKRNRKHFY